MVFNAVFVIIFVISRQPSAPIHAFLDILQYSFQATGSFPIVETTDSGERGMNHVAMATINPRKE